MANCMPGGGLVRDGGTVMMRGIIVGKEGYDPP